jgi:hypothetical protein
MPSDPTPNGIIASCCHNKNVAGGNFQRRISWRWGAGTVITGREMKAATQQAAGEPAAHPANQLAAETTPGKTDFRLPTGFPRFKGSAPRNPRAEHRQAQRLRVDEAVSLAAKYPHLKTLKVALEFVDREGMTKTTEMKYSANPEHAKSVLVFVCPISECCGGDFDLTAKLADAVSKRRTKVAGEMPCLGSHKKASGQVAPCRSVLRYTLNLAYSGKRSRAPQTAAGPAA